MGFTRAVRHAAAGATLAGLIPAPALAQMPPPAEVEYVGGLLDACAHSADTELGLVESARCTSYIDGLTTGMAVASGATGAPEPFCVPKSSVGEIQAAILKRLRARPDIAKMRSGFAIWFVLREAYPCKRAKRK